MTKYQLLATDMDGTLLRSDKTISQVTIDAIDEAVEKGKVIVFSTGRALIELSDYLDQLKNIRYGILASGSLIYDFSNQQVVKSVGIPHDILDAILDAAKLESIMIQGISERSIDFNRSDLDHIEDFHMEVYKPLYEQHGTFFDDLNTYMRGKDYGKVNFYHATPEGRNRTYERIKHLPLSLAYAEETSLEISPIDVSKGQGLIDLCEYLGIPVSKTIAVGDSDNDLDVLAIAGLSIAVGNANDRVKQEADVIVDDNDHDGVGMAIHSYLLK
ncbi:MAG: HAD family phosphatase [Erysipelotrichaceae bacterium]|nr:HAD family phosphatase [Erysipelotrichaceae bacterium]